MPKGVKRTSSGKSPKTRAPRKAKSPRKSAKAKSPRKSKAKSPRRSKAKSPRRSKSPRKLSAKSKEQQTYMKLALAQYKAAHPNVKHTVAFGKVSSAWKHVKELPGGATVRAQKALKHISPGSPRKSPKRRSSKKAKRSPRK